jgi:hypothetical protein
MVLFEKCSDHAYASSSLDHIILLFVSPLPVTHLPSQVFFPILIKTWRFPSHSTSSRKQYVKRSNLLFVTQFRGSDPCRMPANEAIIDDRVPARTDTYVRSHDPIFPFHP